MNPGETAATRRILQIDGGGVKGIIPATVLARLETLLEARGTGIAQVFNQIIGTSTGAILGACLAAGVPAKEMVKFYTEDAPRLFKPRPWWPLNRWLRSKYDRQRFKDFMAEIRTFDGVRLGDLSYGDLEQRKLEGLSTSLIVTAFNLCSSRTHFLKSTDPWDARWPLVDVVSWSSLSAVHFFGGIPVPDYTWNSWSADGTTKEAREGAWFQDGGQGFYNNAVSFALTELCAAPGPAWIVSCGDGTVRHERAYHDVADKPVFLNEMLSFLGNQAVKESVVSQVLAGKYVCETNPAVGFVRWDCDLPADREGIDRVDLIPYYAVLGAEVARKVTIPFPLGR